MGKYFEFVKIAFQEKLAYRTNTFFSIVKNIITLLVQIAVWKALYLSKASIDSQVGLVTLKDMLEYTVMANILSTFLQFSVSGRISEKVKTGSIAIDFIRPINFHLYMISYVIGEIIYNILFSLIPFTIFVAIFYDVPLVSSNILLPFIFSVFLSFLMYFCMCYLLGLCSFWFFEVWPFEKIFEMLLKVFSGMWIPIWFFPNSLAKISEFMPFKSIYYTPLSIYMNKVQGTEVMTNIMNQIFWIAIFLVMDKIVWNKCNKKVIVQGG